MEGAAVALDGAAHAADAKAVVGVVALAAAGQVAVKLRLHGIEVLDAHGHHGAAPSHVERYVAALRVLDGPRRLYGVVQGVSEERVDVGGGNKAQRGAVGNARECDVLLGAGQALLGENGVQGLVAGLDHGVVHVDLARDVLQGLAVHHVAPVREVADLMADVVALDVDGVDILLGEAVLALPLCQQALGLGLLVAHAPCIEDLVLGKEHEGA